MRTVGPRPCSPAGVRVCTVIFFWKLSSDTPLYMRAARQSPHLTITAPLPASFWTFTKVNEGWRQDDLISTRADAQRKKFCNRH